MQPSPDLLAGAGGAFKSGFGAVLEIEVTDGGCRFFIDGRGARSRIATTPPETKPACVWRAGTDTLMRIFEGGRALESAYLSGRLKIAGDMSVMARLQLESPR